MQTESPEAYCFDKRHLDQPVTLGDIFVVTKALLAHGADINYPMKAFSDFSKRRGLFDNRFPYELEFSAPAMFLLEECFNKEPEFQTFAVAVRPLIKTPTRRILRICGFENPKDPDFNSLLAIHLSSADESKLWPFIEKWEDTGDRKDRAALVTAMAQIWEVLRADLKSEEESAEE